MASGRMLVGSELWTNGPSLGGFYQQAPRSAVPQDYRSHTLQPVVTGTSVLGVVFDGGVALAADVLGSYGSLARFRDFSRLKPVGNLCVVGASGDLADFQEMSDMLDNLSTENAEWMDAHELKPKALHSYLTRVLYNRRSKGSPLWNSVLVGGLEDNVPFLGFVDKIGVAYEEKVIATGYGAHLALPLMRNAVDENPQMTEEQARKLLLRCLTVLYYRDARALNKFEIATVTVNGVVKSEPLSETPNWEIAHMIRGYE